MDFLYLFFAVAVFIAVVLLIEGVYTTWNTNYGPEAKRIAQRMKVMSAGARQTQTNSTLLKERLLSQVPKMQRVLLKVPRIHSIDRLLEQSGIKLDVSQFIAIVFSCAALTFIGLLLIQMPIWTILFFTVLAGMIPWLYAFTKKQQRLKRISEQLPDALDLMARALRAGHAFPSALQMVGEEMPEPISVEFSTVFDEVNFGIPMHEALKNLAARVPSTDLNYFVVAVLIQRETGGNLAELLDNISAIIRARFQLLGQIRILTAEGRLSAWVLCLLPFGIATVLYLVNPKYMKLLWTEKVGLTMVSVALIMMAIGVLWMRQLIRIRV